LAPLLLALSARSASPMWRSSSRPLVLGFVTGLIYFAGMLYWITYVMAVYGDMPRWLAVLINVGLVLYLACFPALFALIVRHLVLARGRTALMWSPFVWVASEVARGYLTGFPWGLLGYSQARALPIAQIASVGGVYSVSLLVVAVSAAVVVALGRQYIPLVAVLSVVLVAGVWGSRRVAAGVLTRDGEPVRVGLVQGNVDQATKWNPSSAARIFGDYLQQTRQAIHEGATLVLWPESSTPFMFEEDPPGAEQLRMLARQAKVTLIFGSDQIERGTTTRFYNSAFLIRQDGSTGGVYRKMRLVPFGEYVPMQSLLFFAQPLTGQIGTFTPGARAELLPANGHPVSVAICYEVVYPALVRQFVVEGSELLTTITNDAWFGETSAPYQHFEQASMRAIENGRYLVRAANTGISGIVDPYGRVLQRTDIFQPAVSIGDARFLTTTTFFTRHGELVAYLAVALTLVSVMLPSRASRTM
jgi:apolipoprotein N-acyltransferase